MLKELLKRIAKRVLGDYRIYRVFVLDLVPPPPDPRDDLGREGFALAEVTKEDVARARYEEI